MTSASGEAKICALDVCDTPLPDKAPAWQKYCTTRHAERARNARRGRGPQEGEIDPRACVFCGVSFVPKRNTQKYCSAAHSHKAANSKRTRDLPKPDLQAATALLEAEGFQVHRPLPQQPIAKYDRKRLRGER